MLVMQAPTMVLRDIVERYWAFRVHISDGAFHFVCCRAVKATIQMLRLAYAQEAEAVLSTIERCGQARLFKMNTC